MSSFQWRDRCRHIQVSDISAPGEDQTEDLTILTNLDLSNFPL